MKNLIICAAFIVGNYTLIFAQKVVVKQDSVIDLADFKHNKQYFLEHYAYDDSTKALINTFFRVRQSAMVKAATGVVLSSAALLLINAVTSNHVSRSDDYGGVIVLVFLFPVALDGVALVVDGTITHLIYTRKKLLHIIANYQQGKPLPHWFTHRYRFRQELRKVRRIEPSILQILFPRLF